MNSMIFEENTAYSISIKRETAENELGRLVEWIQSGKVKPANNRARILLVEDEKSLQQLHTSFLEKAGYEFNLAETGEQALRLFEEGLYDLILLDIGLPDMSGVEVGRTIRSYKEGKDIPILALTGFGKSVEEECLSAGFDEVLAKPIGFKELTAILKERLEEFTDEGSVGYSCVA